VFDMPNIRIPRIQNRSTTICFGHPDTLTLLQSLKNYLALVPWTAADAHVGLLRI
jgi:hypothetical protein